MTASGRLDRAGCDSNEAHSAGRVRSVGACARWETCDHPSCHVAGPTLPVVEWVHAFDDTDCFDGSVERDGRYAGTYWCGEGREVRMTGETAPARGDQ